MNIAEFMTHQVITVTPDMDVGAVARLLLDHKISAVPVVDQRGPGRPSQRSPRGWRLRLFSDQASCLEDLATTRNLKVELKPDGAGLTAVGDDAQAIYSFRAATVRNILDFPAQFSPAAEIVTLERNYRSTQPILAAANALMLAAAAPARSARRRAEAMIAGELPLASPVVLTDPVYGRARIPHPRCNHSGELPEVRPVKLATRSAARIAGAISVTLV